MLIKIRTDKNGINSLTPPLELLAKNKILQIKITKIVSNKYFGICFTNSCFMKFFVLEFIFLSNFSKKMIFFALI